MAEVKGRFIKLAGSLMLGKELEQANCYLKSALGICHNELQDEQWYDTKVFDQFMKISIQNSNIKEYNYLVLGKKIYPTIRNIEGLPLELIEPLDFLKYEAKGFMMNHRGIDVKPREFIKLLEREVIVHAEAPDYDNKIYEGVFIGILEMCGVTGRVENQGNDIFKITW